MGRPRRQWNADQIFCRGHKQWHHHSRFNRRKRGVNPEGPIWDYDPSCRLWQQTQRVAEKHEDEARNIVENRARQIVRDANKMPGEKITLAFVMHGLNYESLIPLVRAHLAWREECTCPNCASQYDKPVELDHRAPPRHARDWARLHARNIGPLDRECNTSKGNMPYEEWLDREEQHRLDAQAYNEHLAAQGEQVTLFDDLPEAG